MSTTDKFIILSKSAKYKQTGAALILIAFIIGLGAATYLIKSMSAISAQASQDKKTYQTLAEAKKALIAWAVSHPNHPGILPFPDRNNDPEGYDDKSDCVTSAVNGSHLIGRLPLLSDVNCVTPQVGVSISGRDATGERLWYTVSINLVRMSDAASTPIVNPGIINSPTQPWFVVRDRSGRVISDRVAAVIFSPGAPHPDQDRSGNPSVSQYLDRVRMDDGTPYRNYDYQDPATNPVQSFIIADDSQRLSATDSTYQKPHYFNDKLAYITIDELMEALSKRVASEAKTQLRNYKNAVSYYPNASALVQDEYYQKDSQFAGYLPVSTPTQLTPKSCTVNYASTNSSNTVCDLSSVTNVEFTRSGAATFRNATGSCSRTNANRSCTCNGSGSGQCNANISGSRNFRCTPTGCNTNGNVAGSYRFNGAFIFTTGTPTNVKINGTSGICSGCGSNTASCGASPPYPSTGTFSYDVTTVPASFNSPATNSLLPNWFTENQWERYVFYSVSENCTEGQPCNASDITVGTQIGKEAMLATVGKIINTAPFAHKGSAQTQTGCNINDYLDSDENTDGDTVFDGTNRQRTNNYNDQTFVVAP